MIIKLVSQIIITEQCSICGLVPKITDIMMNNDYKTVTKMLEKHSLLG